MSTPVPFDVTITEAGNVRTATARRGDVVIAVREARTPGEADAAVRQAVADLDAAPDVKPVKKPRGGA